MYLKCIFDSTKHKNTLLYYIQIINRAKNTPQDMTDKK